MEVVRQGVLGITSAYNHDQHKWKQAHTQGAFVISQFILQNQKSEILNVVNRGADDFYININKTNLMNEGVQLISKLLHALQVYKSLGAHDLGRALYLKYSEVPPYFLSLRSRIKERHKSQWLRLFPGMELYQNNTMKAPAPRLKNYAKNFEGIIMSHQDRIPFSESMYNMWIQEWNRYKDYLKVPTIEI